MTELLSLFRGDTMIMICQYVWPNFTIALLTMFDSGKKRCDTVLICLSSNDVEEGHIQVNKVIHNNLRVKLGDLVEFTNILWQACAYFTL